VKCRRGRVARNLGPGGAATEYTLRIYICGVEGW
jgi:hypothetical protein